MKIRLLGIVTAALLAGPVAAQQMPDYELETPVQRFSYIVGLQIAGNLRERGVTEVDPVAIGLAVQDALTGKTPRLTREEMQQAALDYQKAMMAQQAAAAKVNGEAGKAFLDGNAKADGVTVSESGLQYRVIQAGTGETPTETDTVMVHYTGRLLDGTEFDSSHRRGAPTELGVGQVIPGWQEALQKMKVGSQWEVWIPAELAYGERGAGAAIGPNQTLHFEIELVEIKE